MALKDDIPFLLKVYHQQCPVLQHNEQLFNIYEGDLLTYVLQDLARQFSAESFEQVKHRAAPINVLNRLIEKLSGLYLEPPVREIEGSVNEEGDEELLHWYENALDVNSVMTSGDEFYNLFKTTWVEPYFDPSTGKPGLRTIPSNQFIVASKNPVDPTKPTHFMKLMGYLEREKYMGGDKTETRNCQIFWAYTDTEFLIFDDQGDVVTELMNRPDIAALGGSNPYGALPGVYINRSKHCLHPLPDSDTLAMTKIIPILLSDVNFATMFQSFSITYGIDIDSTNLKMSPNAFWSFKSDPATKSEPKIGTIKPEVDSDKILSLVKAQMAMWMQSRGIKPGSMGELSAEDMASGISKVIDQVDTSEVRQKQVPVFKNAESQLWDLIMHHMHPIWSQYPGYEQPSQFTPGAKVVTTFAEQTPLVDPSKLIEDQIKLIDSKLQSREGALKVLNPDMSDDQIEALMDDIEEERTVEIQTNGQEEANPSPGNGSPDPGVSAPQRFN